MQVNGEAHVVGPLWRGEVQFVNQRSSSIIDAYRQSTHLYPVPPHCPHCDCKGPLGAVVVGGWGCAVVVAVVVGGFVGGVVGGWAGGLVPPCPGNGPATDVVIGACST